ncbi:glycosyltransferase family 2 protein [Promicromonospora sp. NPDC050880]|uniref:glycosyltransferase family 2 protein n=1 Tax=Promicromonospora sp. NPDC050880 TaxID=3364406 RepID=UPI0037AC93AF
MPSSTPRVSVVMPVRDTELYLDDAMTSLTRQFDDPHDLEVVVVDDGSGDATPDIAESYADRLPNLTVLRNREPVGAATARNQGLAGSNGRYITYLDGDDWYAPHHLRDVTDAIEAFGVPILRHDHVTVQDGQRRVVRAMEPVREQVLDPRESILPTDRPTMVDYPYGWAGVYDRAIADDGLLTFSDGMRTATDRAWVWRLHLQGTGYVVTNHSGVCYRRGVTTSLTQIYDERRLDFTRAFAEIHGILDEDRETDRFLPKLARTVLAIVDHHLGFAEHMPAELLAELNRRSAELIRTFPAEMVRVQLEQSGPRRWVTLRDVLPPELAPSPEMLAAELAVSAPA